jgi:hypothetical protein
MGLVAVDLMMKLRMAALQRKADVTDLQAEVS